MVNQNKTTFVVPQYQALEKLKKSKKTNDVIDIFDLPKLPRNRSVNKHGTKYIHDELNEISEEIIRCRKLALQKYQ